MESIGAIIVFILTHLTKKMDDEDSCVEIEWEIGFLVRILGIPYTYMLRGLSSILFRKEKQGREWKETSVLVNVRIMRTYLHTTSKYTSVRAVFLS